MHRDNTHPVTFRCPEQLRDAIDRQAKAESRTRSGQLIHLLKSQLVNRRESRDTGRG
jgi:hypothetical protein